MRIPAKKTRRWSWFESLKRGPGSNSSGGISSRWFTLALGDKTKAIDYLEREYLNHDNIDTAWIRADPMLDPLRGDPRFEALAEKILPAREFGKSDTQR